MKKGVILEVKDRYVTLLTPDGEFMRTRKLQQDYQIGEELYFYPMETEEGNRANVLTSLRGMKGRLILLSLVMFLAVVLFPIYESRPAYAYMSIDVNPSIELGLNDELQVISMEAFNQEGEEILDKMTDWKQERAVVVATQILNELEGMGYLNQEKEVLISTVNSNNTSTNVELEEAVKEIQEVTDEEELVVTVVTATPEERENAVKQGITAGVYKQKQEPQKEKEETSTIGDNEKGESNKPAPVEKGSPSKANPSTNGQINGKGHNKEQRQDKQEHKNKNEQKSNSGERKENNNNSKQRQDKQNKTDQNKGKQNKENQKKDNHNKEGKHRGNGNASNGKNQKSDSHK
jgi:hypothetical protein